MNLTAVTCPFSVICTYKKAPPAYDNEAGGGMCRVESRLFFICSLIARFHSLEHQSG